MLKCPVCGNTEFPDACEQEGDIACPVAGCGGIIRARRTEDVRAWRKPKGGSFDWMEQLREPASFHEAGVIWEPPFSFRILNDREAELCGFKGSVPSAVQIPEAWNGRRVVKIAPRAMMGLRGAVHLFLPDTLESIGRESFAEWTELETVRFGGRLSLIDELAFHKCVRLRRLVLDAPPLCVMDTAFAGCLELNEEERAKLYGERK